MPNVDVALDGAGRHGGDEHALDDEVGVALHEDAVDPGAGVAFVGVADEVAGLGGGVAEEVPLAAGGEAGAAASPEAALEHELDDGLGLHIEGGNEAFVAPVGKVVIDVLGVDLTAVGHQAADLAPHEGVVLQHADGVAGGALDDAEGEVGQLTRLYENGLHKLLDAVGRKRVVEDGAGAGGGAHGDGRFQPAEAPRTGGLDVDVQAPGGNRFPEGGECLGPATSEGGRIEAEVDLLAPAGAGGFPALARLGGDGGEAVVHASPFTSRAMATAPATVSWPTTSPSTQTWGASLQVPLHWPRRSP